MSVVKADWRLADLLEEGDDPFDAMIYSSGLRFDLRSSEEELQAALCVTVKREADLWNRDIRCELREGGQDCLKCPAAVLDATQPLSALCRTGKDQQTILDIGEKRKIARRAPLIEIAASVEPCMELGHLSGVYEELLASVGL